MNAVRLAFVGWCLVLASATLATSAAAQNGMGQNGTAPADTVEMAPPEAEDEDDRPPLELDELAPLQLDRRGAAADPVRPARRPVQDVTEVLARQPGSFHHDLGAIGWPHSWSPHALNPNRIDLSLDGRSYNDLFTGRPRYDLLPIDLIAPLHLGGSTRGLPLNVSTRVLEFDRAEPLTEIRYRRATNELQSPMQGVTVFHTQRRRLDLFGEPGALNVMASYTGIASDNEYNNSELRRGRHLMARAMYRHELFSLEVANRNMRRRVGAHSGVVPPNPGNFASIYDLVRAQVQSPAAHRRIVRNELNLTSRFPLMFGSPADPLRIGAQWAVQFFTYAQGPNLIEQRTDRFALDAQQSATWGRHRLTFSAEAQADLHQPFLDGVGNRSEAHATITDSLSFGQTNLTLQGGGHLYGIELHPSLRADFEHDMGSVTLGAQLSRTAQPPSWAERTGMRGYLFHLPRAPVTTVDRATADVHFSLGPLGIGMEAFGHQLINATDLFMIEGTADRAVVERFDDPIRQVGASVELNWRRHADRGFYVTGHASAVHTLHEPNGQSATLPNGDLQNGTLEPDAPLIGAPVERLANALPPFFGQGRIGARYVIFNDLDFDAYIQGRFWGPQQGRTLHAPSGLMALPAADSPQMGIGSTVSVFAETEIRGANIFLGYKNAASGTPIQPGALIVPVYPLPAQQFTLGVWWPITG